MAEVLSEIRNLPFKFSPGAGALEDSQRHTDGEKRSAGVTENHGPVQLSICSVFTHSQTLFAPICPPQFRRGFATWSQVELATPRKVCSQRDTHRCFLILARRPLSEADKAERFFAAVDWQSASPPPPPMPAKLGAGRCFPHRHVSGAVTIKNTPTVERSTEAD